MKEIPIEHLLQTLPDLRLKCIVMTAIYTGLRRKEISRLLWSNIQLESDYPALVVDECDTKNGKQSGAPPRVAQEAMRHSDSRLTEQTYTDCSKLHVRAAINALPSFRITGANTGSEIATGECF